MTLFLSHTKLDIDSDPKVYHALDDYLSHSHVERCRVLLHIVEATFTTGPDRSPVSDYQVINAELANYAPTLADKPQIVVLNKTDATEAETVEECRRAFAELGVELHTMSAATGQGTAEVLEALWTHAKR